MKKKLNKRKNKLILPIFIPCASVIVATAIIAPAICLTDVNEHMTYDIKERTRKVQTTSYNNIVFTYTMKDKDVDFTNLKVNWEYALSSSRKLHISDIKLSPITADNKLKATATIVNGDDAAPNIDDNIGFNLTFTYYKDNKALWSADFVNYFVRFIK